MSLTVGIRELRQQASAVLRRVTAGETVEVTDHGHRIARLVPIHAGALEQLDAEGRVTPAEGYLLDLLDEFGLPVGGKGPVPPSAALDELRAEER